MTYKISASTVDGPDKRWEPKLKKYVQVETQGISPRFENVKIVGYGSSANLDAFGRQRVSNPYTLFDSKQIYDNLPLFWDDQETSGGGTSSTYNSNQASTTIGVTAATAGTRVRQTYQWFNYQPGKSQMILMTMAGFDTTSGITKRFGYFNDQNGLFFESAEGTINVVRRTYTSGSAVNNKVAQSSWNLDPMDGTGPSQVTLDFDMSQIAVIDFEWLGVGRVRMGWVVDGMIYYCHEFLNANNLSLVYMSTPNLPLRYEISNSGTGAGASFTHICSSVESEGGQEKLGVLRHKDSGAVTSLASGTKYAMLGIRLKSGYLGASILIETLSLITTVANNQLHWELVWNPTVAGTFTYSDQTNSAVQIATGSASNTVTNGLDIDGGYLSTSLPTYEPANNALKLGSAIDGTPDEIVLTVKPITNNITVQTSLTWRELS